jgi:acyl-CoA synthetase (AMP-forming)/AMP-acid ligase II
MGLTRALHRSVQLRPDAVAVRFGGRQRTFRQFADRTARLASALQSLGVRPKDRVAMLALNSDRYLEYLMAVPWAGAVLNPCNIRWAADEIAYTLDDSGSTVLIFDDAFAPLAATLRAKASALRILIYAGDGQAPLGTLNMESLIADANPVADAGYTGNELAGVFYTGGTTGRPKGVMLSHDNLVWHGVAAIAAGIGGSDGVGGTDVVIVHAPPMFHVAGFAVSQMHWLLGSRHVTIPAFRPDQLAACIERERATDVVLVPTMIQMLLNDPTATTQFDLSSLRRITYAGSPISATLLDRAIARFPSVDFFQAYGQTESTGAVTVLGPENHTAEDRKSGKMLSAGRATCISLVRIVDPGGSELPRRSIGEIAVRGPTTMLGYWERPAETAKALRDGWLRTGDAGYMDDDGFIFIVDRLKDMIITGGENVYSTEVENALATHPGVAACAVVGIPSDEWGESIHAFVVLKTDHTVSAQDLAVHCHAQIANYKCPRSIEFLDALPLSGAGKVLKAKLREPFWQGRTRLIG